MTKKLNFHNGVYYCESPDDKALGCIVTVTGDLSKNEKPMYLSMLMDKEQLQVILDNEHLFDRVLVNSAYLLLSQYDVLEIAPHR